MIKNLRITVEGKAYDVTVEVLENGSVAASAPIPAAPVTSTPVAVPAAPVAAPIPAAPAGGGDVPSPLSGKVVSVDVKVGDSVTEGQNVITLEAMKMNTFVTALNAGTVNAIHVNAGDSVDEGQVLISIA